MTVVILAVKLPMKFLFIIIALLLFCAGCVGPVDPGKNLTDTGKVSEDLKLIDSGVKQTIPQTSGEVAGRLKSILIITDSALKLAPELEQAAADYAKEVAKNAILMSEWFSPKMQGLFWWIVGGIVAVVVGMGVMYSVGGAAIATGIIGFIGKACYWAFHFMTLGIFAIFSTIKSEVASAAASHAAVTTAQATANETGSTARVQVTGAAHVTAIPQVVVTPDAGTATKPIGQ